MVTVVTISAPSSEEVSKWFNVSGIVYESTTGNPISGAIVNIYYDGKSLGSATTGVDGDYLDSVRINEAGYFKLESIVGSARASRYITITEPEPQVITTVTISAPSSAEKNKSFTVSGTVKDQYGVGVAGASVALFDNESHFATVSTNSAGGYSKSHSISSTGIHKLAANAGTKWAYRDITITTPEEPPPTVIVITISAPSSAEVGQYFAVSGIVYDSSTGYPIVGVNVNITYNGTFLGSAITGVDGDYLASVRINAAGTFTLESVYGTASASRSITITEPAPETYVVGVAMYDTATQDYVIGTLIVDGVRYTGVQYKVLFQVEEGIHIFNVEPPAGYTFVEWQVHEYGGPPLYTSKARPLSVNIDRNIWVWAEVAVEAIPPVVTTVTISAPSSAEKNKSFTISGTVKDQFGVGMGGASVALYDNGSHFATVTTNSAGVYSKSTSISLAGVHELAARADSITAYRDITIKAVKHVVGVGIYDEGSNQYVPCTIILDGTRYAITTTKSFIVEEGVHTFDLELPADYDWVKWIIQRWATGETIAEPTGRPLSWNVVEDTFFWGVLTLAIVDIPTTTTISAPSKVAVNEKFNISGILYETESGIPIPNQPINHSYNGKGLGSSITGVDGDYLKEVSIPEADTWTIKSEFLGTEALQASRALVDAVVTATPIETALLIAGPTVTGIALFIYGVS